MVQSYGLDNDSLENLDKLYSLVSWEFYMNRKLLYFVEGHPKLAKYAAALLAICEYCPSWDCRPLSIEMLELCVLERVSGFSTTFGYMSFMSFVDQYIVTNSVARWVHSRKEASLCFERLSNLLQGVVPVTFSHGCC